MARRPPRLDPQPYEHPYDPVMPVSAYALATSRHMHQYGTTRRQLAEVAVAARAWARLNPEAFMRDPLMDDVLAARMVSRPADGARLLPGHRRRRRLVLVRADRAKDLPQASRSTCWATGTACGTARSPACPT
jgi:acetyl-CoA acetyltransferase